MLGYNRWTNKLAIRFLYLLLAMVFVSYLPTAYSANLNVYLSRGIMVVMAIVAIISIFQSGFLKNYFFRALIIAIIFLVLEFSFFSLFQYNFEMDDVRQLLIVFLCMVVGYFISVTEKQFTNLCLFYIISTIALGGYAIIFYTGSFSFATDRTLISSKNQVGAMVAVGGALALYFNLIVSRRKLLFLILSVLAFAVSAVLRDRSAFVALIFYTFIISFKKIPAYKVIIAMLVAVLIYIFFRSIIDSFFTNALIGRGSWDIDDLSTGRAERNRMGIQYLYDHFWDGELLQRAYIPWIHNYLLLRLVRYGVWSMLFMIVYFKFVVKIIKETLQMKRLHLDSIGFFVPIIPFFISMLEPSFPFGPGTVQFFVYVLFGQSLQKEQYRLRVDS